MGKPVTVPIPLIQDQLFICALLLNFPNNLAGGTHAKGLEPKAQSLKLFRFHNYFFHLYIFLKGPPFVYLF